MKLVPLLAVLLIVSPFADLGAQAPAATAGTQAVCPIMGNKINPAVSTVFEGKKIYFCCPGCVGKFLKTPQAIIDKMEKNGVVLETVAVTGAVPSAPGQAPTASGHADAGCGHGQAGAAPTASDPHQASPDSASHGCCGGH